MMSEQEMTTLVTQVNRGLGASGESVLVKKEDWFKKGLVPMFRTIMKSGKLNFHYLLPKGHQDDATDHTAEWNYVEKSAVELDNDTWTESPVLEVSQIGGICQKSFINIRQMLCLFIIFF
jgi:hypothetical protein